MSSLIPPVKPIFNTGPKPLQPPQPEKEDLELRDFNDIPATRNAIYNRVYEAASGVQPLVNDLHTLALSDVKWRDPEDYSQAEQKRAILEGRSMSRRMQGTWTLTDNATGGVLDTKNSTIANVPYLTGLGTFINNGNKYGMKNQQRLRSGVFSRVKDNGEIEAHANILPGKGPSHRYFLEPEKGVFYLKVGQAKVPLMPLMRAMGATDDDLRKSWGKELLASNYKHDDPASLQKLYTKLIRKPDPEAPQENKRQALAELFNNMEVDPEVTKRTLGQGFTNMNKETILATTNKLLRISRNEAEPDDRDALPYQRFLGPEDLLSERISSDSGGMQRNAFWKASFKGNLKAMPVNLMGQQIQAALLNSGLGQALEEINPAEIQDKLSLITRMGEGGIPTNDAVPEEARSLQPSHFGFIDPVRTPESGRVGVDTYLSVRAKKGKDGNIYSPFLDAKTGKEQYFSPQQLADKVVAFPGQGKSKLGRVIAMHEGKMKWVKPEEVDLSYQNFEDNFSPMGRAVPLKSAMKGQRGAMASRMFTQALPLEGAEAPLVQSGNPDDTETSYEDTLGTHFGAVKADQPGVVQGITPEGIKIKHDDGSIKTYETYDNYPFNRKTYIHSTPTVEPGQRIEANGLLARSNFTDSSGTAALGLNARVAYVPFKGLNFEDAIVISEGMAKRLTSEHMYQHDANWAEGSKHLKQEYISLFPGKYDKKILENMGDDGIIKPGAEVHHGQPLILLANQRQTADNKIHRKGERGYTDASVTWDHHDPGVVTDVAQGKNGPVVVVKSKQRMQVGDKLTGRYGDKGVIADIIPDHGMPQSKDGQPFEVLLNPLGIISRTNPAQKIEAALGKIAKLTGKPYKVQDFKNIDDLRQFAEDELAKHGLRSTETIIDPETERKLQNEVHTGNRFFMKLHHTAESKGQGRSTGGYTQDDTPSKGGATGSKRISLLDTNALLSHGATNVLRDAGAVRGQRNEEYWLQFMQGYTPRDPKIPFVYEKFVNQLQGAGINVVNRGGQTNIMALTDKDLDKMAGAREITNPDTVNWKTGLKPVKGGLFDPELTGGHHGRRWSAIKLHEPMPSPVMEEPIRRVLGLTKPMFNKIIKGDEAFRGMTGPASITRALKRVDVDKEIALARLEIKSGKKGLRDKAVRKLGYLKSAKENGLHPGQWVMKRVPVLPPAFRPVSTMGDNKLPLVSDPNFLYQELIEANNNLKAMQTEVGDDVGEERLALYNSFKAVTGLGEPITPKLREKKVKGLLKSIFGSSPKLGTVQRKLLSSTVDNVGRAVITPNPDLDMDHVGLPENKAWDVYETFVTRRLKRKGMPLTQALREVKDRTDRAREELVKEMEHRPVIINRAPVLHRYGILAFWPRLTKNDTLQVSPLVVKGFNADFDGDAMQYHVPGDDDARTEAIERMMPSRSLISPADFKTPVHAPSQEYVGGLYEATAGKKNKPARTFATVNAAKAAWHRGEIDVDDPVVILDPKREITGKKKKS